MHDLLQLMYQDGFLSSTELVALRKTCRELKESPVRVLRSLNVASSTEVQSFLQRFYGCSSVTDALVEQLDESFKALIPVDIALNYNVFAIAEEDLKLFVAVEDPTDVRNLSQLEFFLDRKIVACVATAQQLARGLSFLYGFDVSHLKLSTILESSRGVVGGKNYDNVSVTHQLFEEKSELLLDDALSESLAGTSFDFKEPGETLNEVENLMAPPTPSLDSIGGGFGDDFMAEEAASSGLGMLKAMDSGENSLDLNVETSALGDSSLLEGDATTAELDSFEPDLGDEAPADPFFENVESAENDVPVDIDALLADESLESSEPLERVALPPEFLVKVSAVVNATLVRLSLQREKSAALARLNQSLAELQIQVLYSSNADGVFTVTCNEQTFDYHPNSNVSDDTANPLAKVLTPALKKIASLH